MAIVVGYSGALLYDVGDPLHPRVVCRITNTSARILTGTSFEYLAPGPNGTTRAILHALGSNNESVAGTFAADIFKPGVDVGSPFANVSWVPDATELAYSTDGPPDPSGAGTVEVWVATSTKSVKLFSYSVPGVDSFGRPGLPPPVLALSPDGAYLVGGWALGQPLHVFRLSDRAQVSLAMPSDLRLAVWSRTGHTLYLVGGTVEVWTPESGAKSVLGTSPWTLTPNFSPDGSQVAFTGIASNGVRIYVYDFKAGQARLLIDKPRSAAMFVKSGWIWYLEEAPCVAAANNVCFDPTQPDGKVLAINLANGQELPVTLAAGESPVDVNSFYMASEDLWPLA